MQKKILIIKLGYSETLDPDIGKVPSLGDVIRTTPILWALREKFPKAHVTWLVSEHAEPLLNGNRFIDRLLVWDEFIPFQLMKEKFDVLINLEKIPGVCALADMIDAWTKYGFRFENLEGTYHGYERGLDFMSYLADKRTDRRHWQRILIEMMGSEWKEQPYIIGYKPKTKPVYDIGFNFEVGSKWPCKAMPMHLWKRLEKMLLDEGYSVSWQQGRTNLYEYMDWLNSCRLIISTDSLGLHLAFALNKKTIGLFGPTDPSEVFFYGGSKIVTTDQNCPQNPCYCNKCATELFCMEKISMKKVMTAVHEQLAKPATGKTKVIYLSKEKEPHAALSDSKKHQKKHY